MGIVHKIEASEILDLFRKALIGEIKISLTNKNISLSKADGIYEFNIDDYLVSIFFDNNELDYVDSVIAPDGRKGDYDYWTFHSEGQKDPIDLLSEVEHKKLEELLHG